MFWPNNSKSLDIFHHGICLTMGFLKSCHQPSVYRATRTCFMNNFFYNTDFVKSLEKKPSEIAVAESEKVPSSREKTSVSGIKCFRSGDLRTTKPLYLLLLLLLLLLFVVFSHHLLARGLGLSRHFYLRLIVLTGWGTVQLNNCLTSWGCVQSWHLSLMLASNLIL